MSSDSIVKAVACHMANSGIGLKHLELARKRLTEWNLFCSFGTWLFKEKLPELSLTILKTVKNELNSLLTLTTLNTTIVALSYLATAAIVVFAPVF